MFEKLLTKEDVENLVIGASILGSGGGGDPYIGKLMLLTAIEKGKEIKILDVDVVDNDDFIIPIAAMGTPTVLIEKLPSGREAIESLRLLEQYFNREAKYITPIEAGGINSTIPLVVGALTKKPVLDGDGMGRAFPELQMVTFHLVGVKATPMAMADEKGNAIILDAIDNYWAEKLARTITIRFGGTAWIAIYPMFGSKYREGVIRGTVTLAISIGHAIREAKKFGKDPIDMLLDTVKGFILFRGKIIDVKRFITGGFAKGEVRIEGLEEYKNSQMTVLFQNENLVAIKDDEVVASTPDIITIIDAETGKPITTERLKYGLRVMVIGIPCNEKWRSLEGLKVVGPKYFGYNIEYKPVEEKVKRE